MMPRRRWTEADRARYAKLHEEAVKGETRDWNPTDRDDYLRLAAEAVYTEDEIVEAWELFERWRKRATVGYLILIASVVIGFVQIEGTAADNEEQADQLTAQAAVLEQAAPALRRASVAGCERGNDVREDIQHDRDVLRGLVTAAIQSGLNPALDKAFRTERENLREPIPLVRCRHAYPEIP